MMFPMRSGACWGFCFVTIIFALAPVVAGWLHSPCNSNDDCTVANAECFSSQCECTPGFFYSEGSQSCVETCSQASKPFDVYHMVIYKHSSLNCAEHLILKNEGLTRHDYMEKCLDPCNADSNCLSVWFHNSDCSLYSVVPRDTGTDFKRNVTIFHSIVVQKTCA
ncbi:uncharacterized protein [Littorina saxatilis]|uniref:Apple domain-containing protein n=1 Tax=Littorina saxatilis TaxID=31220 RepID=A0AAN9ALJ8_9CAEN